MKVIDLRNSFLSFFEKRGHTIVPSSPLIPVNDETLLFTNAGMVQFKDVFLGREVRPYSKAASSQCCVRAGGKHNDLENVGYTARHHTFFEMLGNFSFGDYFKREAIQYAWEYLTEVLKLPKEKLWVTVFQDDEEAADIWLKEMKVEENRFSRCGVKDNFWSMGDTGPCGPCTEIFYDHGPQVPGGPPGSTEEGDRYIEIWNLVFMQFNRDINGDMTYLPKTSVDTGMGLERLAAVMQGVKSVYQIDLFKNLILAAAKILHLEDKKNVKSLQVLADHIRSSTFLIAEGIIPSNEGRGYVLRRIMRRALRHGNQLGATQPFFYQLVAPLVAEMGETYPKIKTEQSRIEKIILKEEEQFARTLAQGLAILENEINNLPGHTHGNILNGEILFKLYDTYGFPVDLTADVAREHGLQVDFAGFEHEMEAQRERARTFSQFSMDYGKNINIDAKSEFTGYETLKEETEVLALVKDNEAKTSLKLGEKGQIVLKQTPFYAESGGQVGDTGVIYHQNVAIFRVDDTQKIGEAIIHIGEVIKGDLSLNDSVIAEVDAEKRQATRLNHSATHLLHAALREILGKHVIQKGSLVAPDRLRFDFSHFEPLSVEEIKKIENRVNEKILENSEAKITIMTPEEAIKKGALALFGEKYGDKVRVLDMGHGFSVELCGGTHTERTGDIGLFKIISETGIAAGIRRIDALTGKGAMQWLSEADDVVTYMAQSLKTDRQNLKNKIEHLLDRQKELEKETQRLKSKLVSGAGADISTEAISMKGIKLLVKKLSDTDPKIMRELVDDLKNKLQSAVIVLATVNNQKVQLIVGVTKNFTNKVAAGELANFIASQVGGKGGGRPDLAQAGGAQPQYLDKALESVADWVNERI